VLVEGGNVSLQAITSAVLTGGSLENVFVGPLQAAAALGDATSKGGRQTAFEKACDDALNTYLQSSRMTPFGDSVLVAYMAARENEITAARIILSGRLSGVPTQAIRERLREAYV
jgi:V/A-type H+-transporting ATPase subunit C